MSVDYERHGRTYAQHRRADPRIAARIHAALGDARTVVNVSAGTGSYEPTDRWVLAVEMDGLRELRRIARGPVVVFAFDLEGLPAWQHEYLAGPLGPALERLKR